MNKRELEATEKKRCVVQQEIDAHKSQYERNKLGQFATPERLASEMLLYSKFILAKKPVRFLDPSFGTGSFYSSLLRHFSIDEIEAAKGFEIDSVIISAAKELWKNTQLDLVEADFTRLVSPAKETDKFNLVICNPPYVRHHHLNSIEKKRLQRLVQGMDSNGVSGLSGLYCYFMLLTHVWMQKGGVAGWLIPTEFMDTNYGVTLRKYLTEKTTLLRLHRFNANDVQFSDALVSSAVVWFRNESPQPNHTVEITFGGSLTSPVTTKRLPNHVLSEASKWNTCLFQNAKLNAECMTLSDFFDIKRGLATGDNKFFILNEQQIAQRQLPTEFLRPILPGSRFLPDDEVTADENGLPNIEKRLFLLDCDLPEETIRCQYPTLWAYLEEGIRVGVADRYLCSHRKIWYKQERRPAPPFLCTYMARKNKQGKTFRFIFNRSEATAANTYILLYPKNILRDLIDRTPNLINEIWSAICDISQSSLLNEGRSYGGGMHKLEPKELSRVAATPLQSIVS